MVGWRGRADVVCQDQNLSLQHPTVPSSAVQPAGTQLHGQAGMEVQPVPECARHPRVGMRWAEVWACARGHLGGRGGCSALLCHS